MPLDNTPQIFIDMEWEHAENSSGAPLSIGAVRTDTETCLYGRWPLRKKNCSQWTLMQVVPQLESTAVPASVALDMLLQWQKLNPEATFWVGEEAVGSWLMEHHKLPCQLWPGPRTEYETIQLWWCAQQWLDTNPRYHALWDARGMLAQWEKINGG